MRQRVGLGALRRRLMQESGQWAQILPQIPRLVHANLIRPDSQTHLLAEVRSMRREQRQSNRLITVLVAVLAVAVGVALWALTRH
jgi:ubiquinone biosynthesis protein